jgi:hypothetical protein
MRVDDVPDQSAASFSRAPASAEFGAAGQIALEPAVQRLADEVGARQNQEAESGQDADGDPEGS